MRQTGSMVNLSLWPRRHYWTRHFHTLRSSSGQRESGGQEAGSVMDSDTQTQQAQGATLVITGSFTLIFSVGLDLGQLSSSMSWPLLGVNSWYIYLSTLFHTQNPKLSFIFPRIMIAIQRKYDFNSWLTGFMIIINTHMLWFYQVNKDINFNRCLTDISW